MNGNREYMEMRQDLLENKREYFQARKAFLQKLLNWKREALAHAPQGSLRISEERGKARYYIRSKPEERTGRYLREEQQNLVYMLAQKEYDQKVLRSAEKELRAIDMYLKNCPDTYAEEIFNSYTQKRQELISPIKETERQYVERWKAKEYVRKPLDPRISGFCTDRGERVRSKSELIIANTLEKWGIPYRYEAPIVLRHIGTIHPDFTVLRVAERKELYWEHLGMMDDSSYCGKALDRIKTYEMNDIFPGDKLILTHETMKSPLNTQLLEKIIKKYLL